MAVDQAKYMNFFTEIVASNNNININKSNIVNNINHQVIPVINNESFQPVYKLNDVVFNENQKQQFTPAVKDDSGITFNNSLIPPPTQPSRKRSRDPISCVAPPPLPLPQQQLLTMHHPISCVSKPSTTANTGINLMHNDHLPPSFAFLGQDLSLQIMQQDLEFHRLISNHMERMKVEIEERKKEQLRRIMGGMEESLGRRLSEKEEELTKIARINYALEEKVKSLCLENQIWRDLAQTNEATANALRTNLEQLLEQMNDNAERKAAAEELVDDAVSSCGSGGDEDNVGDSHQWMKKSNFVDHAQNGWIYRGKSGPNANGRLCRKCGQLESSVLLLPCRHLCLCITCGPAVNSCPICDTLKNATLHVNLSSM